MMSAEFLGFLTPSSLVPSFGQNLDYPLPSLSAEVICTCPLKSNCLVDVFHLHLSIIN